MGIRGSEIVRHLAGAWSTVLYCDKCNHSLGIYRREGEFEWFDCMNEEWNNCPWCGEPLHNESKI